MKRFFQGDTFSFVISFNVGYEGGNLSDLSTWTGDAKLVNKSGDLADLSFAWIKPTSTGLDDPFSCAIGFEGDTSVWPLGWAQTQVQLTTPGGQKIHIEPAQRFSIRDGV